MRWEGGRQSGNVEDRRGGADPGMGSRGGGFPIGGRGIGIGGLLIALVVGWIFGINPLTLLGMFGGGGGGEVVTAPAPQRPSPQAPTVQIGQQPSPAPAQLPDRAGQFVSTVLASTEDVWSAQFKARQATYRPPRLVLFERGTRTACGVGRSAMGPFYCPADQTIYLDTDFFRTLSQRLGAPGEFAQAYVIAHEVAHHVQNLLGITGRIDAERERLPEAQANALSVRIELQADCLAGVWARNADASQRMLEEGDIESAMNAAAQIGDDTLQRRSQGMVVPESFTHGTSAERVGWFKRGYTGGRVENCNTFQQARR